MDARQHLTNDIRCGVCGLESESLDHLFRQCLTAHATRLCLINPAQRPRFVPMDFYNWLVENLASDLFAAEANYKWQRKENAGMHLCLLLHIFQLIDRDWIVEISHLVQTANQVADGMAKLGRSAATGCRVFEAPPADVIALLQDKMNHAGHVI
ncbi:hypothetical protein V6N11_043088 [Hibiscus sabdariffa]|uniref:RNase H type-1 domain-containing protein n=1 Tax=Hibiscus sabdariffa TaxID=183260 RepID=A0ABR2QYH4_9ROSI